MPCGAGPNADDLENRGTKQQTPRIVGEPRSEEVDVVSGGAAGEGGSSSTPATAPPSVKMPPVIF